MPKFLKARTAYHALSHINTKATIDVMITDLSMPEMDGVELVQALRRHPTRYQLPAIALTGFHADYMDARGFDAFLRKPVDLDELCSAIRNVVDPTR